VKTDDVVEDMPDVGDRKEEDNVVDAGPALDR
jgi:hypothetical protein